jgi:hypothetical protein
MTRTRAALHTLHRLTPHAAALPASVHGQSAAGALVLLALAAAALYAALCLLSPAGRCRKCHGFGFATRTDRRGRPRRGKTCRRCHGDGAHTRIGRRLLNAAR